MDDDNANITYQEELLEELWIEIFIRLPVKTVLRVGCVCKHWRALVYNRSFQKKHLELQKKMSRNTGCFILGRSQSLENTIYRLVDKESIARDDSPSSLESLISRFSRLVDYTLQSNATNFCIERPINGLYCVHNRKDRFVIWNPATSEAGFLPDPKCSCNMSYIHAVVGFGADPLNEEDYKVLLICKYGDDDFLSKFCRMLYTTSSNSWRVLEDGDDFVGSGHPFNYSFNKLYLNGKYYVLAEEEKVALEFDMGEKEAFRSVSLPKFNSENTKCHIDLVLHEDHINLFIVKEELCNIDVWILIVEERNWIKKITIALGLGRVIRSLGFWRTEEELILATKDFKGCPGDHRERLWPSHPFSSTALYNTKTQEVTFVTPIELDKEFKAVFCFESLASLSGGITKYKDAPASLIDKILYFLDGQ